MLVQHLALQEPEVGEVATYTATFAVTQEAVELNRVENTVDVSGRDPANTLVQDDSDDGDDDDGNQFNDPTIFEIEQNPSIEVVKDFAHVDNDGNGEISSGDRINYIITIENTGNNTLGVAGAPNNELVIGDTVQHSLEHTHPLWLVLAIVHPHLAHHMD